MEDFDKAIEDTIIVLNTGVLRDRDGIAIKQAQGKSAIQNPIWKEKFEAISDMQAFTVGDEKLLKQKRHIVSIKRVEILIIAFQTVNLEISSILQGMKY